ncbi:MAG: Rpn family recombination-promoting nuclease/putative transposase [Alphaproteobacteria bacterium]|nr:Rpn family recombination-promoting nuclease/putative transposase [Alphaproteobacteria bacterium]
MSIDLDQVTPQNDVVFKMIFADPKHERVLLHFLNSAIEVKSPITKVKILNSELTADHVSQKGSRLDIQAETNSGELIDIEMQVGADEHMVGRTLFYWSRLFAGELQVSDNYGKLRRTISINILNFKLFHKDARYWRKCHLTDDESHEIITDLLEIQFVELNKLKQFTKESPLTFWIEFFKNPYSEECKELYKFVPELKEAREIFEAAKADPVKRRLIQEREESVRNFNHAISSATERGIEEGKKIGIEKGKAEGAQQKAIETAKKLLEMGLKAEQVSEATGLSVAEIEKLK